MRTELSRETYEPTEAIRTLARAEKSAEPISQSDDAANF
jgi:hypothetical protein